MSEEPPKIIIVRKEIYDPSLERFVTEDLPTMTVHKAVKLNVRNAHVAMASHYVGSGTAATGAGTVGVGSVGRLTYLNIYTGAPAVFYMKDRKGTIGFHGFAAAGEKTIVADAYHPARIVEGSFSILPLGTLAAGTYTVDFEIVKRSQRWV